MSRIWQIRIVGGGPAGCAAALATGLQPDQVLLLEAQSPWREKLCGDAITHSDPLLSEARTQLAWIALWHTEYREYRSAIDCSQSDDELTALVK
jgi:flavin-dependent dehydrogenase